MDARTIFNNILHHVETSQLNYSVSKTPFSATISLKCSLVNIWNPGSDKKHLDQSVHEAKIKKEDIKKRTEEQEDEIKQLKSTIKSLERTVNDKKSVLEVKSKKVKDSMKSAEDEKAELREELLQLKRERNKLKSKNKSLEDEIQMVKGETENMKNENVKLRNEKQLNEDEVKQLKMEKATIEQLRDSLESQLEKEKIKLGFKCEKCAYESKSQKDLKEHTQTSHYRSKSNQVKMDQNNIMKEIEFSEYACYYCKKTIKSF